MKGQNVLSGIPVVGRRKKKRYVLTFICPADNNQVTTSLKHENTRKEAEDVHHVTYNNNTTAAHLFPLLTGECSESSGKAICMEGIEDSIVTPFFPVETCNSCCCFRLHFSDPEIVVVNCCSVPCHITMWAPVMFSGMWNSHTFEFRSPVHSLTTLPS